MNNHSLRTDREQAEKLAELGRYLCQLRQEQGLSLQQVADQTLIPVRLLTAIETGNLSQLPEPVYIQGFIRRYGDAIGMNGSEFAQAFPTQVLPQTVGTSWRRTIQTQLRPLHLYLLYMVLVMGAVGGLSFLLRRTTSPEISDIRTPRMTRSAVSTMPATLPYGPANLAGSLVPTTQRNQPQSSLSSTTFPSPNQSGKPVRIGLVLTDQSWIRVVADGKMTFEGVLPEGTQRAWSANKQLTLRAGNAGGVMVSFNDGESKRLGEPGAVEEVTFGTNSQAMLPVNSSAQSTLTASNANAF